MAMHKAAIAAVLFALTFYFSSTGYTQDGEKPPLSFVRIGGEIVAGSAAGLAGGVLPALMIERMYPPPPNATEILGPSGYAMLVALAGYPLGSATGVYLVGGIGNETGSFFAALAGAFLGELVSLGTADWFSSRVLSLSVLVLGAPVGATIGFNLTRKYGSSANSNSQMNKAAPSMRLNLLRLRF